VRQQEDWEAWIDFFLEGVAITVTATLATSQQLI
jgi:hypothetical protein